MVWFTLNLLQIFEKVKLKLHRNTNQIIAKAKSEGMNNEISLSGKPFVKLQKCFRVTL